MVQMQRVCPVNSALFVLDPRYYLLTPVYSIIEGLSESLERLQMDYVDIYFAHRPDPTVPMEEVVRAFNYCINSGKAYYWATSEWSAEQIEEAYHVADKLGLIGPIAEQAEHNLFHRERPELEYLPIYKKYGIKTTVWSALASGVLTGKASAPVFPLQNIEEGRVQRRAYTTY
jgi:aryl-alcohol dehydrogenase-like predicted oxidoreductase